MPITIVPTTVKASVVQVSETQGTHIVRNVVDALPGSCKTECKGVVQCSVDIANDKADAITTCASDNGFVYAVINAYNSHHHLKIRPEDVWLAILTQLNAYINKHADELRGKFVAHEGKKDLVLVYDGVTRHTFDYGLFARDMSELLQHNVTDPELREWVMPAFSTTTSHDTTVASIVMMATLQSYFTYTCITRCGLPSVTLLGEKADWEEICSRLKKLKTFGTEPTRFRDLLRPILRRFVQSFDEVEPSVATLDFWQCIVSENKVRSGANYYSGWITAFCYWDAEGNPEPTLTAQTAGGQGYLELDNVIYHTVSVHDVPPGWAKVPVKLIDNGQTLECVMVAGAVGIDLSSSGGGGGAVDTKGPSTPDTMSSRLGWWLYEK